jgi:hypothetical protein
MLATQLHNKTHRLSACTFRSHLPLQRQAAAVGASATFTYAGPNADGLKHLESTQVATQLLQFYCSCPEGAKYTPSLEHLGLFHCSIVPH